VRRSLPVVSARLRLCPSATLLLLLGLLTRPSFLLCRPGAILFSHPGKRLLRQSRPTAAALRGGELTRLGSPFGGARHRRVLADDFTPVRRCRSKEFSGQRG
jgi:hypothetical protein